jgi:hypothetical protein
LENVIKSRNFDPETRTLRKGGHDEEDTVEMIGVTLAQTIVADDEVDRQKELVSIMFIPLKSEYLKLHLTVSPHYCSKAGQLGFETPIRKETGQAGSKNSSLHQYVDPFVTHFMPSAK